MTDVWRGRAWRRLCVAMLACAIANACASDADIQAIVDSVSEAQYTEYQKAIESMGVGAYGGAAYDQGGRGRSWTGRFGDQGNQEARAYIVDKLTALGLAVAVQGKSLNVVAELPGVTSPAQICILCAHYDTGSSRTPGGDHDASGTAGMLEAARVLSQYSFAGTIRFVCFNGQEKNLAGSNEYLKNVVRAEKQNVIGFINYDMIVHPYHDEQPHAPFVMGVSLASDDRPARDWAKTFIAATTTFVPGLTVDSDSPYLNAKSDPQWFNAQGLPAFTATEDPKIESGLSNSHIHTAQDASDMAAGKHYDYAFAATVVKAGVATLAQTAGVLGPNAGGGGSQVSDLDNDGFADDVEAAFGSDPQDPLSRPLNLPPAAQSGALSVGAMAVKLNFAKGNADSVTVNGTVPVPLGLNASGQTVIVDVGGVVRAFALDASGKSTPRNSAATFTVQLPKKASAQLAPFTVKLTRGSFAAQFAKFGLRDATMSATSVSIPVTLVFINEARSSNRSLTYRATQRKTGAAK